MQNPLNSKVAPKRESIKLPHNPANVARGNTHSCFKPTTLVEHVAVNKPKRTNVKPITLPANAAASSPVLVTPPFVPFRTGYILKNKKPISDMDAYEIKLKIKGEENYLTTVK